MFDLHVLTGETVSEFEDAIRDAIIIYPKDYNVVL
jgi:hypothetical protein